MVVDAADFLVLLRARVDWLNAKVQAATTAWADYVNASRTLEQHAGARPFTARQSWIAAAVTWIVPGAATAQTSLWSELDRRFGSAYSNTFGDLRTALRRYDLVIRQQDDITTPTAAQRTEIRNKRSAGDALRARGMTVAGLWLESGASAFDPKISTEGDAALRLILRVTPAARWEASAPGALLTGSSEGSATGASTDVVTPPQPEQAGLPPWVAPVVGGILVVGVGYALWNYSRSH